MNTKLKPEDILRIAAINRIERIIIICHTFRKSRLLVESFYEYLKSTNNLDITMYKRMDSWEIRTRNEGDLSIMAYPNSELALCGVRGEMVLTDLFDDQKSYRERVIPMLCARINDRSSRIILPV